MFILSKISIYKMMQIHRENQRDPSREQENLFDKYILSLFQKENYQRKNTALRLKTIRRGHNPRNAININDVLTPIRLKMKKKRGETVTDDSSGSPLAQKGLNAKRPTTKNGKNIQAKCGKVRELVKAKKAIPGDEVRQIRQKVAMGGVRRKEKLDLTAKKANQLSSKETDVSRSQEMAHLRSNTMKALRAKAMDELYVRAKEKIRQKNMDE
ncbi:hypothetical protein PCYB_112560, partial [Plasmodium cynomolgi strain B]